MSAVGIVIIILLGLFVLLWIPVLAVGIVLWRKGRLLPGIILTVLGGGWGLCALAGVGLATAGYLVARQQLKSFAPVTFDPATYQGPVGTLVLDWTGPVNLIATAREGEGRYALNGEGGKVVMPTGEFTLDHLSLAQPPPAGGGISWMASLSPQYQKPVAISVLVNGEVPLAVGPPFRAKVEVRRQDNGKYACNLLISNAAGMRVSIHPPGGKPELRILDAKGEVLLKQNFEFG